MPQYSIEDFFTSGDPDYTAAAIASQASGEGAIYGNPNKVYPIASQVYMPSHAGFKGNPRFLMLTGSGQFDASTFTGAYGANKTGFKSLDETNVTFEARVDMDTNAGIRTCNAVTLEGLIDPNIKVVAAGFKDAEFAPITFNSIQGGTLKALVRDCSTNDNTLAKCNLMGVCIDGSRLVDGLGNSINSTGYKYDFRAFNITQGSASKAAFGIQSTGVGIYSIGWAPAIGDIISKNSGQCVDFMADGHEVRVSAEDGLAYCLKLIHGASYNHFEAMLKNAGITPFVIGTADPDKRCQGNTGNIKVIIDKQIGSTAAVPALVFDGSSANNQPINNSFNLFAIGDGTHMSYATDIGAGSNNTVNDLGSTGYTCSVARIQSQVANNGNQVLDAKNAEQSASLAYASKITQPSTASPKTICSLTLPPGEWDISGLAVFIATGQVSAVYASQNTVNDTMATAPAGGYALIAAPMTNANNQILPIEKHTISITTQTTIHLVAGANYSSGAVYLYGELKAIRRKHAC